jgi:peptidoglycan/xylan/chitin deacetylase (PgdA/CDA1 family)
MAQRLVVFGFHNVQPSWLAPVPPAAAVRGLHAQCRFLRSAFNVLALDDALDRLVAGRPLPGRAAAITFDDGYRDNLEVAAPILARHGLPATVFLVTGVVARETRAWWELVPRAVARARRAELRWEGEVLSLRAPADRRHAVRVVLGRLKRRETVARDVALDTLLEQLDPFGGDDDGLFLDWEGAARLARSPGISIGSHTVSHAILSEECREEQRRELAVSRATLEHALDVPVRLLAFPNGTARDYDANTIAVASETGYTHAVTTRLGINGPRTPRFEARRIIVRPETGVPGLARPLVGGARRELARHRRAAPPARLTPSRSCL